MMSEQPRTWAESLLVAYVDGQLDPAQTQAVEESLRSDPEARAIVGTLRAGALAVAHAYDEALDRPLPEGLRALFDDVTGHTPSTAQVLSFPRQRSLVQRLLPLAASIAALMVGFGAGYAMFGGRNEFTPAGEGARGEIYLAALQQVLEAEKPGASQSYADSAAGISGTVTAIGPVTAANLGTCREFRHDAIDRDATATSYGIACRDTRGSWRVEIESASGE